MRTDAQPVEPVVAAKTVQRIARLEHDVVHMRDWLAHHPDDRPGANGAVRQSHDLHIGQSSIAALSCRAVKQIRELASVAEVSGAGNFERHSLTGAPICRALAAPSLPPLPP